MVSRGYTRRSIERAATAPAYRGEHRIINGGERGQ